MIKEYYSTICHRLWDNHTYRLSCLSGWMRGGGNLKRLLTWLDAFHFQLRPFEFSHQRTISRISLFNLSIGRIPSQNRIIVYVKHSIYLISNPFSCKLLSFGSGGTFPTHALIRCPPTEIVQEAHSPLLWVFWGVYGFGGDKQRDRKRAKVRYIA
jgi:hypothetical protein